MMMFNIIVISGDRVSFIVTRSRTGPTSWVASQVHVRDEKEGKVGGLM